MLEILRDLALKLLGALVPKLLGWLYKPARIEKDIKIRPLGEGEAVTLNAGDLPSVQIWLLVSNLSPFSLELDRVLVQLQYGGVIGEFTSVRKVSMKPASETQYKVESPLTSAQVRSTLRSRESFSYSTLYITAYINCKVHNIEVHRNPQTSNVRVIGVPGAA